MASAPHAAALSPAVKGPAVAPTGAVPASPPRIASSADTTTQLWANIRATEAQLPSLRQIEDAKEIQPMLELLTVAIDRLKICDTKAKAEASRLAAYQTRKTSPSADNDRALFDATDAEEKAKEEVVKIEATLEIAFRTHGLATDSKSVWFLANSYYLNPHLLVFPWYKKTLQVVLSDSNLSNGEKQKKIKAFNHLWNVIEKAVKFEREAQRNEAALSRRFVQYISSVDEREAGVDFVAGKFHPVGVLHNLHVDTHVFAKDVEELAAPTKETLAQLRARATTIKNSFDQQAATLKALCEQPQTLDLTHLYTSSGIHLPANAEREAMDFEALDPDKLQEAHKKIWDPMQAQAKVWRTLLAGEFNKALLALRQKEIAFELAELKKSTQDRLAVLKADPKQTTKLTVLEEIGELLAAFDKRDAKKWLADEKPHYIVLDPAGETSLHGQLTTLHTTLSRNYDDACTALKKDNSGNTGSIVEVWKTEQKQRLEDMATQIEAKVTAVKGLFGSLPQDIEDCKAVQHKAVEKEALASKLVDFNARFEPLAKGRLALEALITAFDNEPATKGWLAADATMPGTFNFKGTYAELTKSFEQRKTAWKSELQVLSTNEPVLKGSVWQMACDLDRYEYASINGTIPNKTVHDRAQNAGASVARLTGYRTTHTDMYRGTPPVVTPAPAAASLTPPGSPAPAAAPVSAPAPGSTTPPGSIVLTSTSSTTGQV